MASYGAYMAICGYQYDGPEGILSFAPRIQEKDFRAAFTTAEGWGSFSQKLEGDSQKVNITLDYGKLTLKSLRCKAIEGTRAKKMNIQVSETKKSEAWSVRAKLEKVKDTYHILFKEEITIKEGQVLQVSFD